MDGAGSAGTDAANALWRAAADALAWKASIRNRAARAAHRKAWSAMVKAAGATEVAATRGPSTDARNRTDAAPLERAVAALRDAADMMNLASKELRRSSRLHRAAAAARMRSSKAYKRAADAAGAAGMDRHAARSHDRAMDTDAKATIALEGARQLLRDAVELAARVSRLPAEDAAKAAEPEADAEDAAKAAEPEPKADADADADAEDAEDAEDAAEADAEDAAAAEADAEDAAAAAGEYEEDDDRRDGGSGAPPPVHGDLRERARRTRARSAAKEARLAGAERRAAKAQRLAAARAGRSAKAAAAVVERGLDDQDAQKAAAAWKRAMESAGRADARGAGGRGRRPRPGAAGT